MGVVGVRCLNLVVPISLLRLNAPLSPYTLLDRQSTFEDVLARRYND
jgi:hypothetical protein